MENRRCPFMRESSRKVNEKSLLSTVVHSCLEFQVSHLMDSFMQSQDSVGMVMLCLEDTKRSREDTRKK